MAARNIFGRVEALESEIGGKFRPYLWLVRAADESEEEVRARYEQKHGPIGDAPTLVWVCTGVPRGRGTETCA